MAVYLVMHGYADATATSFGTTAPFERRGGRHARQPRHLAAQLQSRAFVLHQLRGGEGVPLIDHVAVSASGVWVIASRPVGLARIQVRRPFRGAATLLAGDRDQTELVEILDRQRTTICAALANLPQLPIHTAICFPGGQFRLLGSLAIDGHLVLPPSELAARVGAPGGIKRSDCRAVAEQLVARLG